MQRERCGSKLPLSTKASRPTGCLKKAVDNEALRTKICFGNERYPGNLGDQWFRKLRDMKTKNLISCGWVVLLVASCALTATNLSGQGSVVFGGRINLETNAFPLPYGGNYQLTVLNTPDGADGTAIFVNRQTTSIAFQDSLLDEASGWYFAGLNDSFTAASIGSGDFVFFGGHPNIQPGPWFDVGYDQPFYLAVASGRTLWSWPNEEPYWIDPVFGWGLFNNTPSGLVLLDSAMAYGSEGIFVGTMTAVPEPATTALFFTGAFVILGMQRILSRKSQ